MQVSPNVLDKVQDTPILIIGDVMLDAYLWGAVDRISPESPVPVVDISREEQRLGGAGNVALNIGAMGGQPLLCSVVGQDQPGEQLIALMKENGMSTAGMVSSTTRRTTVKTRIIGRSQQMLRVDREDKHPLQSKDREDLWDKVKQLVESQKPAAILFQDYNKGVLNESLIKDIIKLANERNIPVAVDPKRENFFSFSGATLFKPNLKELKDGLHQTESLRDETALQLAVAQLRQQMPHTLTFVTRSELGVWITDGTSTWAHPAHIRSVSDVSGAGDTVIAVATLLLAHQVEPDVMAYVANLAGGLVCEQVGVVPIDKDRLKTELSKG